MKKLREVRFTKKKGGKEDREPGPHLKITFIFDFIELNLEETSGSQRFILA